MAGKERPKTGFALRLFQAWHVFLARTGKALPHAYLAKRTGLTRESVTRWFGGSIPDSEHARAVLADELGVPRQWLYDGKGKPPAWLSVVVATPPAPPALDEERPSMRRAGGDRVRGAGGT